MKNRFSGLRIRAAVCAFLLILTACLAAVPASAVGTMPTVEAKSAILMEASTGKILGERMPTKRFRPHR